MVITYIFIIRLLNLLNKKDVTFLIYNLKNTYILNSCLDELCFSVVCGLSYYGHNSLNDSQQLNQICTMKVDIKLKMSKRWGIGVVEEPLILSTYSHYSPSPEFSRIRQQQM